jgi:alkaline phosphatase D
MNPYLRFSHLLIEKLLFVRNGILIVLTTLLAIGCAHQKQTPKEKPFPILQSFTTSTATQLIILTGANESLTYKITSSSGVVVSPSSTRTFSSPDGHAAQVTHINLTGLNSETVYELQVHRNSVGQPRSVVDSRLFSTMPKNRENFRLAIASCINDEFIGVGKIMWKQMADQKPDAIFLIGDNVYSDRRNGIRLGKIIEPKLLWERFSETRQALPLFYEGKLTPTFSIWDDHDFGMNDGNMTNPHRDAAKVIFRAYFGDPDSLGFATGPGVSFSSEIGAHKFIFADDRFDRTPNNPAIICKTKPNDDLCKNQPLPMKEPGSHFGKKQSDWIFSQIKGTDKLVWLISGDQWFGGYHPFESFEGSHHDDFRDFTKKLKSLNKMYLFVSGDRHLSEVMKISPQEVGHNTYEITSSAIHSKYYPSRWEIMPNPRQIFGLEQTFNFAILDINLLPKGKLHSVNLQYVTEDGVLDKNKIKLEVTK